ncbi:MAG: hypothetical protein GY845_27600 [Planctomycetes bacterium]|nr:hypothetical protein [Planctomycetota bacterium]
MNNNSQFDSDALMKSMPRQQQNLTFTPDIRLKLRMLSILKGKPMNRLLEELVDAMWALHCNDETDVKLSRRERKRIQNIIAGAAK